MNHRRSRLHSLVTAAVLLMLIAALLPSHGGNALAQEGDSYTFDSNDKVLEWSSPWENDESNNSNDSGVEFVVLNSNVAVLLVGTIPSELDLEEGRDLILDEFANGLDDYSTIDRGAYENFSYSLDQGTIEGADFGIFTLFRGGEGGAPTEILVFLGIVEAFTSGFESAQTDITLDGDELFNGVDGAGLEAQLGGSGTTDQQPDETTPESDTPNDNGGSDVLGDVKGGSQDNETPEADKTPESDNGGDSGSGDTYVSPQFDVEIAWNSDFDPSPDAETSGDGFDSFGLNYGDQGIISFSLFANDSGATADQLAEVFSSDEYLKDSSFADGQVLLVGGDQEVAAVVILFEGEGNAQLIIYQEIHVVQGGDSLALVTAIMPSSLVSDVVTAAHDGVTIDGQPLLTVYDGSDVEAEL